MCPLQPGLQCQARQKPHVWGNQSVFCLQHLSAHFFSFTFAQIANPIKQRQVEIKRLFDSKKVCFVFHISSFICRFFSDTPPFFHLVQNSTEISLNRNHTKSFAAIFVFPLPVCDSVESVNDGLFHTVQLLIQNRSLSLVVDSGAPKSLGKLARQPSVDHNTQLYIGGKYQEV